MQTNPHGASLFADHDFGFTSQLALSAAYYRGCDPGKVEAIARKIAPGDFESAFQAYHDAGAEALALAGQALAERHTVSAREAYLWAASYFRSALRVLDGAGDPARILPCWREYAVCWPAPGPV